MTKSRRATSRPPVVSRPARTTRRGPRSAATRVARRRWQQRLLASTLGAAVLAAAVSLAVFHRSSSAGFRTTSQGWVLPRLGAGGNVSLASLRGRPVVVNFFASWCTVCAGELPVFATDALALRGRVDVVEVNALETGNGQSFAQQYHLASDVTALVHDVGGSQGDGLYQSLGGTGTMPMTAFYDARGHLLTTHVGGFDAPSLAAAIRQLYGVNVPA